MNAARRCRGPVVGPGDAVVEQQRAGAHLRLQEAEVRRVVVHADVLGQPDRRHRVEAGLGDVAVVAVTHLGEVGQALLGDGLLRPRRLLLGQRDADRLDAVAGRVAHHAAPAAADVEQPVARLAAAASRTPAGTCSPAPPPATRRGAGSTRRCRSSTGRAPTRRTCSTRRSGGGSPRRRESCCAASLLRCGASGAAPPAAAVRSA